MTQVQNAAREGVRWPVVVTGFGLGAFIDGIVLHQLLQWHHLVVAYRAASTVDGLRYNTVWDGAFHMASWTIVLVGVFWLVHSGADVQTLGWRRFTGLLLAGWGGFNVTDQVVFHLLLGAHHVRMVENYQVYDWGYTALGVALIIAGLMLARGKAG